MNNLRYADNTTLMAESEEKLNILLMKVKQENKKAGLKLNSQKIKIMASGHITSWQIDGENNGNWQILFSWAPKSLLMMTTAMILKDGCSLKESYDKSRQHIKKQRHHFAKKDLYTQSCGFSSSHIQMWELDHKEGWALKN